MPHQTSTSFLLKFLTFIIIKIILFQCVAGEDQRPGEDIPYLANGTLINIRTEDERFFEIRGEAPHATITFKGFDENEDEYSIETYMYIFDTPDIEKAHTHIAFDDAAPACVLLERETQEYDYALLFVAVKHIFTSVDKCPLPKERGPLLISNGFESFFTISGDIVCDKPWYLHILIKYVDENDKKSILLRAVFQMDMEQSYGCDPNYQ